VTAVAPLAIRGVRLGGAAADQLRALDRERRDRVAHVLQEMAAVLEVTGPSRSMGSAWLQFTTAGVRVLYSIAEETGLLVVHDIADSGSMAARS
jgi:mRNA-degrading endonuclease RelE of RelBE toxin-antitoxin system